MNEFARPGLPRTVIPAEQIQKRVREMGRQISDDYRGQSIHLLALLENGFIFMADLVRALEVPVICQFIKPKYRLHEDKLSHHFHATALVYPADHGLFRSHRGRPGAHSLRNRSEGGCGTQAHGAGAG